MLELARCFGGKALAFDKEAMLDMFTSEIAIIIYIFIILAIVAVLVVALIFFQRKDESDEENIAPDNAGAQAPNDDASQIASTICKHFLNLKKNLKKAAFSGVKRRKSGFFA